MKIHTYEDTRQAYTACQCDDKVDTGDLLLIPSEKVVGLAYTWPIAMTKEHGELHTIDPDFGIESFIEDGTFTQEQVDAATQAAIEMEIEDDRQNPIELPENSGIVVCYGAGVDSTAMLLAMYDQGIVPDLITFADTGAEKPETYEQVGKMNTWLESVGWPTVTWCRKKTLDSTPYEDLTGNNLHNETLPSLAFGMKSCSIKWKQGPQDVVLKGAKRGPMKRDPHHLWLKAEREGVKLVKLIGYDSSPADIRRSSKVKREDADFLYAYPLQDLGWTREDCIKRIIEEGLEVPIKSACFFCPASQKWELWWLAGKHPDLFMQALDMEHRAMVGKHSRWGQDDCTYGTDWEELCKQPGTFPSTDVTVGLGRSFAWNHWARQNKIVDADGNFIACQDHCLAMADELKAAGGNAADRRACA